MNAAIEATGTPIHSFVSHTLYVSCCISTQVRSESAYTFGLSSSQKASFSAAKSRHQIALRTRQLRECNYHHVQQTWTCSSFLLNYFSELCMAHIRHCRPICRSQMYLQISIKPKSTYCHKFSIPSTRQVLLSVHTVYREAATVPQGQCGNSLAPRASSKVFERTEPLSLLPCRMQKSCCIVTRAML